MPKMGELREYQEKLENWSKKQTDSASLVVRQFTRQAKEELPRLEQADDAMMDWMKEFEADAEKKLELDEAMAYYQDQKERIERVKHTMLESIDKARELDDKLMEAWKAPVASDSTQGEEAAE